MKYRTSALDAVVDECHDVAALVFDHLEDCFRRFDASLRRDLQHRASDEALVALRAGEGYPPGVPAGRDLPHAAGDVVAYACPRVRVSQPGHVVVDRSGLRPAGHDLLETGACGSVRVHVVGDVQPLISCRLEDFHHARAVPVGMLLGDRQVGELHRDIGPPAYLDSLLDGGQMPARADPRVGSVEGAVDYRLAERHDLVCRGVSGRRPGQAGRDGEGALLHRLGGQTLHHAHPVGVCRPFVQRARGHAQRRVADLRGHVDAGPVGLEIVRPVV